MRRLISSGSPFEAQGGFSRAVVDGEWVFVAGTTGFDYIAMTISDDPAEQTQQALRNIERALAEAGRQPRRYRAGALLRPRPGGLAADHAGARRSLRDDPAGGDRDHLRPRRSAHEIEVTARRATGKP